MRLLEAQRRRATCANSGPPHRARGPSCSKGPFIVPGASRGSRPLAPVVAAAGEPAAGGRLAAAATTGAVPMTGRLPGTMNGPFEHDRRALDDIAEFAHVAGPLVRFEQAHRLLGHPGDALAVMLVEVTHERLRQQRHIVLALAQRRQRDEETR